MEDEPFNPDYTVAERVLDMATQEEPNGEVVTHYLVKWKSLPYEDSTWELKEDIDPKTIQKYHQLQQLDRERLIVSHFVSSYTAPIDLSHSTLVLGTATPTSLRL